MRLLLGSDSGPIDMLIWPRFSDDLIQNSKANIAAAPVMRNLH
jgi:hypothetical protein